MNLMGVLGGLYANRNTRVATKLFILALTITVLAVYGWSLYANLSAVGEALKDVNISLFVFAVVFSFGAALLNVKRFQVMVNVMSPNRMSFKDSFKTLFSAVSLGNITPAHLGEFSKIEFVHKKTGIGRRRAAVIPMAERAIDIAIFALFAIAIDIVFMVVFIAAIAVVSSYLINKKISSSRSGIAQIVFFSVAHKIGLIVTFMIIIYALNADIAFIQAANILSLSLLAGVLSYLPGGWGTREFTIGAALQGVGFSAGVALLAPILYAVLLVVMTAVGLIIFYRSVKIDAGVEIRSQPPQVSNRMTTLSDL